MPFRELHQLKVLVSNVVQKLLERCHFIFLFLEQQIFDEVVLFVSLHSNLSTIKVKLPSSEDAYCSR